MGTIGSTLRKQHLEQEIRERERIEQEMRVARSIQQASLPEKVPELEGWQISPFYHPAREVGGDFYDFFELEAVMNSIRNSLEMRETEIAREPNRLWNPHFYAIFAQVHNTL